MRSGPIAAGWPEEAERQIDWLSAHRVHPALSFATWDVPAADIVAALATRARVERLVLRAQGLDAPALLVAYREELVR